MDAAELRRQKILRNSSRRMELLMGIKNQGENSQPEPVAVIKPPLLVQTSKEPVSTSSSLQTVNNNHPLTHSPTENLVQRKKPSILFTKPVSESDLTSGGQIKISSDENINGNCKFNGYSNNEIAIMFLLAFATSLLFYFEQSAFINESALLPFVTFELGHLLLHFKSLPSTGSQFQMFQTLLRLCGIPQRSLTNLMTVFNFLFILVDNFAIYLFSFVVVNLFLGICL